MSEHANMSQAAITEQIVKNGIRYETTHRTLEDTSVRIKGKDDREQGKAWESSQVHCIWWDISTSGDHFC